MITAAMTSSALPAQRTPNAPRPNHDTPDTLVWVRDLLVEIQQEVQDGIAGPLAAGNVRTRDQARDAIDPTDLMARLGAAHTAPGARFAAMIDAAIAALAASIGD